MRFLQSPFLWYVVFGVVMFVLACCISGCFRPPPDSLPLLH